MAAASEIAENVNIETSLEDSSGQIGKTENKIQLTDLKVADLKTELEKRDLDKTGVKSVLLERLKNALVEEGEDPEKFTFESVLESSNCKSPPKKKKVPSAETNGDISSKELNEVDMKEDVTDSIEVDIKDEVIDGICDEVIDANNDIDDKCSSSEVTLQLSIDEEDAQLNDDEIEVSKPAENEIENKPVDKTEETHDIVEESSLTEIVPSVQSAPEKPLKPVNEVKEKKKTSQLSKNTDTSNTISPKVLKVLGKNDKIKSASALAKSLWITGLPSTTRAADLKELFSKQGRVLSVKIVKSTKQTPGKCYGFVTMATSKDASKAIQNLHRTELNGRTISVERTQNEPSVLLKKSESKLITLSTKKQVVKKEVSNSTKAADSSKSTVTSERKVSKQVSKTTESKSTESSEKQKDKNILEKSKIKDKERRPREHREREIRRPTVRRPPVVRPRPFAFNERPRFGTSRRSFAPRPYVSRSSFNPTDIRLPRASSAAYSLQKIRAERLRLRAEREVERRRLEEITRHRYIERKQREEAYRLEREKEKLRLEREMLERERAEILKLEREKQRLERERLEREREELRRQSELRRGVKRPISRIDKESEQFWDSRKKSVPRYEARTSFPSESSTSSRYQFPVKERSVLSRHEFERRSERYHPKPVEPVSRVEYEDREPRREVTIRTRDERQVYDRSVYRADRDGRPSFQDRERHSTSKRESPRVDWKHDRRVHERVVSSTSSNASRRMYY